MELLSAGVFTEEVASGESAILAVSTSTYATGGWLPRGYENVAQLVTSLPDFFAKYGSYWKNSDVALAVTAFFKNGGSRAYVFGVRPDDAVAAAGVLAVNWNVKATSRGAWGNQVRLQVSGNQNHYDHATALYDKWDVAVLEESSNGAGDFVLVETFEAVDLVDTNSSDYFPLVLNDESNGSKEVRVDGTGVSGGIPVALLPTARTAEAFGTGTGAQTAFMYTAAHPAIAPFTVVLKVGSTVVAKDDGRGRLVNQSGSGFTAITGPVNYTTGVVQATFTPAPSNAAAITLDYVQAGASEVHVDLVNGADGTAVTRAQVTEPGLEAANKGLYSLDLVDEILNIGLPDFRGDPIVAGDVISYAENRGDCFAILDMKKGIDAQDAKNYKQVTLASLADYAAIYWPGVKVADPLLGGRTRSMSPVGHVAGVYARTDSNKNVGKAPAGTVDGALNFCAGLDFPVKKGHRDLVYPVGINPLIDSTVTGRAVWGGRTLAISGDFTLVQVRRLFIFLRKSFYNSTQDLVFESIDDGLFGKVALRSGSFMRLLTQEGYFASRIPSEAFRVVVDSSNNTPESIAARQLITDILVATQTPAEFVRFRFQRSLNKLS